MKLCEGLWIPDKDITLEPLLKKWPKENGIATYQYGKFKRCMELVKSFGTAVDVGAHIGTWSRLLANRFNHVIAFEPVPDHVECFMANVPFLNARISQCAIGQDTGKIRIHQNRLQSLKTNVLVGGGGIEVDIHPLDSFGLAVIDFLKIDCEGWERPVVAGAEKTIKRSKPVIIVEQKRGIAQRYGMGETDAVELLKRWGAKVIDEINGDYIMCWA